MALVKNAGFASSDVAVEFAVTAYAMHIMQTSLRQAISLLSPKSSCEGSIVLLRGEPGA